jgi:hypothetical protein
MVGGRCKREGAGGNHSLPSRSSRHNRCWIKESGFATTPTREPRKHSGLEARDYAPASASNHKRFLANARPEADFR